MKAKKTLAASTEEWDELLLSLVFSTGLFPAMNENNLGELCQKISSLKDSGAASRVEAAALPLTELASAGLSAPPLVPNLDGRAFRYKSAVKERRSLGMEEQLILHKLLNA